MIFITVGTHEQSFDRLILEIDRLKKNKQVSEEVIIQSGFCQLKLDDCTCFKMLTTQEMKSFIRKARIVICHGGPSTIMEILNENKIPIVVPRQFQYNEHVNDHQLRFCQKFNETYHSFLLVEQIDDLANSIVNFEEDCCNQQSYQSNTMNFNNQLSYLIEGM